MAQNIVPAIVGSTTSSPERWASKPVAIMTSVNPTRSPCPSCGEVLPVDAYFCGECGRGVNPSSAEPLSLDRPPEPSPDAPTEAVTVVTETPPSESGFMLLLSTGERARVTGRGRIGRMPTPEAEGPWDHLIVVSDDTRTVSKNHLEFLVIDTGLEIIDLDSSNGTVVSLPGVAAERLVPGVPLLIPVGTRVGIGDQWFTIES